MKKPETSNYEYFDDPSESRPFRFNGAKDQFEEKIGNEWAPIKRDKASAGEEQPTDLITNVAFTTYRDWNADPEPSAEAPKSIADQVARTKVGRILQDHTGSVHDTVDERSQAIYETADTDDEREDNISLFGDLMPRLQRTRQEESFNPDKETGVDELKALTGTELESMKEALLDLKLDSDPKKREVTLKEANKLIAKIDETVAHQKKMAAEAKALREKMEIPRNIAKALTRLKDLRGEVSRVCGRIKEVEASSMDYRTRKETLGRLFEALHPLNEGLIREAITILDGLEKMRNDDPNSVLGLVEEYGTSNQDIVNPYKSALIQFADTHELEFSGEAKSSLEYSATKDESYEQKRGGKKTFRQVLVAATNAPKKQDDPLAFLQRITGIPGDRLQAIVKKALES